jgi:hypothetical protein
MSLMKLWALESFMNGKKQEKSEKTIRPPVGRARFVVRRFLF